MVQEVPAVRLAQTTPFFVIASVAKQPRAALLCPGLLPAAFAGVAMTKEE
jgi:hypothetical protein